MGKLIISFFVLLSLDSLSQSSKSIEVEPSPRLKPAQERKLEAREEQRIRQEWDREEEEAQEQEEWQRQIDEERAEGYRPKIKPHLPR